MADWRSYFKGRYLTGPALVADTTAVIARIESALVEDPDGGESREKMVVHFRGGAPLPWIPCRTTGACVAAMYGDDADNWIGKPITLYFDPTVKVGSETKGGVRVRGAPGIRPVTVTVKLPRRKPLTIRLVDTSPPAAPTLDAVLKAAGLTRADVDRWLVAAGKSTTEGAPTEKLAALAAYLAGDGSRLAAIRAMVPREGDFGATDDHDTHPGREPGEEG